MVRFSTREPPLSSIFFLLTLSSCAFPPTHFVDRAAQQEQQPIKTIVVLVLENRSFDHMIGWMKKSINPSINGVMGRECNPVPINSTATTESAQKLETDSICFMNDAKQVDPDPGHSFEDVELQVFGSNPIPSMTGFAEQALSMSHNLSQTVMKGFKPENVPVYSSLVSEFVVFDK